MVSGKECRRILNDIFSSETKALPIGELAVRLGFVTSDDVRSCLAEQRTLAEKGTPLRLGQILLRRRLLTVDRLVTLLSEAEDDAPEERTIGKYRIRGVIGKGGMATVYEAEDPALRRTVALKVVEELPYDPKMTRRFYREAAILSHLRHPHVVAVHDVGKARDGSGAVVHYIAMEFMTGPTLFDVMAKKSRSRPELLALLAQAAEAAGYVQEHGIVHRDIKPSNILLDEQGRAVLTDFGLAHSEGASRLTRSVEILGTPQYMAPEQIEGRMRKIGPATDVYALGVILYEILTGRLPFAGDQPATVLSAALRDDPPPPRSVDSSIPRDLEAICLKAMAKEPHRRYANGKALAADLQRHLRGDPIVIKPTGQWERLWRTLLRRKAPVWAGAASLFLLGGIAIYVTRNRNGPASIDRTEAYRKLEAARLPFETATRLSYDRKASLQEIRKHLESAATLTDEARRLAPELESAAYLAGRISQALGRDVEAETHYREAIRLNPRFGPARLSLALLLLDRIPPGSLESSEDRSLWIEIAKEARDAFAAAAQLLNSEEPDLLSLLAIAMEAVARRDWPLARTHAEEGIRRCGRGAGSEDFHWILGAASQRVEECRTAYETALDINPRHIRSLVSLGGLLALRTKEYAKAADLYSQVIELRPSPFVYLMRSYARMGAHDLTGAYADADALIHWTPALDSFWLGQAYLKRAIARRLPEDVQGALEDFTEAIRLRPNEAFLHHSRGVHYLLAGEWNSGVEDLTRAIELGWKGESAYRFRAVALAEMDRYPQALQDADRAVELSPATPDPYWVRGRVHRKMGRKSEAAADFRKALALAPKGWPDQAACEEALREEP